jgi:aryl-alcohol dehydrogenase-like predicted oxidoreductase
LGSFANFSVRIVSKANEYARGQGLRPFVVYQGRWSAADRDFERDIIPMCRAEGMGLAPWGALGAGNFKTKEQFKSEDRRNFAPQSERQEKLSAALEGIANRRGTKITSVALAYVMHKTPYVFPIVGCRKVSYLKDNIEALNLKLSDEEIDEIEDAVPFDLGFPSSFITVGKLRNPEIGPRDVGFSAMYGRFDWMEDTKPIPLGLHNKL